MDKQQRIAAAKSQLTLAIEDVELWKGQYDNAHHPFLQQRCAKEWDLANVRVYRWLRRIKREEQSQ